MVLSQFVKIAAEKFTNCRQKNSEHFMNEDDQTYLRVLIILSIWLCAVLFVGMWLWNNIAVKLVSFVKPMTSIWQLLGLAILIDLIHPSCC